jgi:hypothetical protein
VPNCGTWEDGEYGSGGKANLEFIFDRKELKGCIESLQIRMTQARKRSIA